MPGIEIELKGKTAWVALGILGIGLGIVIWNSWHPWSDVDSPKAFKEFEEKIKLEYILSKIDELEDADFTPEDIVVEIRRLQRQTLPGRHGDVIYKMDFTMKAGDLTLEYGQRDYRYARSYVELLE